MMLVGHTHEDIDALFKLISTHWRKIDKVLNPVSFMHMLKDAISGASVHPIVEYVHVFADFFKDFIYKGLTVIKSACELIFKERNDEGTPLARPLHDICTPLAITICAHPWHRSHFINCMPTAFAFGAVVAFWYNPDSSLTPALLPHKEECGRHAGRGDARRQKVLRGLPFRHRSLQKQVCAYD
eukprot:3640990-Pleurochrysis_carterae.AAC.7